MKELYKKDQADAMIYFLKAVVRYGKFQNVTIFTNPSARAGYDTRSFFKRSLTGLNSEFSFS